MSLLTQVGRAEEFMLLSKGARRGLLPLSERRLIGAIIAQRHASEAAPRFDSSANFACEAIGPRLARSAQGAAKGARSHARPLRGESQEQATLRWIYGDFPGRRNTAPMLEAYRLVHWWPPLW